MNFKRTGFAFILLLFFFSSLRAHAQRIYMDSAKDGNNEWTSPIDGVFEIEALTGFINSRTIQLKYSNDLINSGVTTYIKASVSSFIGITVQASNSTVQTPKSIVSFQEVSYGNETYLAVTPGIPYNTLEITVPPFFSYVYLEYAFKNEQIDCGSGFDTFSTTTGSSIKPASKVTGERNAIDSKSDTYSSIYIAPQQQGVSVSQNIYFNRIWAASDVIRLYLSGTGSVPKPGIAIQTLLNGSEISKTTITPADFTKGFYDLTAAGEFDQVNIILTSGSNGNKQDYELKLYEVQILPSTPAVSSGPLAFCEDATTSSISISQPVTGLQYNWYDEKDNPLQKGPLTSYTPADLLPGSHSIKITASRPGCPESAPTSIDIYINPKPNIPTIEPIN